MCSQGSGQPSQFLAVARQRSFYSLTLDEVQNQLVEFGKPLGRMNLYELVKNVWSGDLNLEMRVNSENADAPPVEGQYSSVTGLQCQGSMTLSNKTVDEVWREIQEGKMKNSVERKPQECQPTLGEMTLEDFLVKAGVVDKLSGKKMRVEGDMQNLEGTCNVGSVVVVDPMSSTQNFQQTQWMQYQHPQHNMVKAYIPGHAETAGSQRLGLGASPLFDVGYSESQMVRPSSLMGTMSDTTPGRKRVASGDKVEKSIERRQKRMIKNRESAARSRARKQAYTNELENKVSRLEEENERLRKQNDLERMLHYATHPEPRCQLRRTSSSPL